MNKNLSLLLCALLLSSQAIAKPVTNRGGLGCGKIISLRETTQQSLPTELRDGYGGSRTSGGQIGQVLNAIPGVGIVGAVVGDLVGGAIVSAVSSNLNEADRNKQIETATFKNVQAIEFQFDDGEVINIPIYVVSGMRYKVGTRLNAMVSPKYGNIALGQNVLFGAIPEIGDADYNLACRIDDAEARKVVLESAKNLIDESRIVDPQIRRLVAVPDSATLPK